MILKGEAAWAQEHILRSETNWALVKTRPTVLAAYGSLDSFSVESLQTKARSNQWSAQLTSSLHIATNLGIVSFARFTDAQY